MAGSSKARIGIVGSNEDDCKSSHSRIGFGTAGYPADPISCGDVAKDGDKGDKFIKAMGYIFVGAGLSYLLLSIVLVHAD